MNKLRENRVDVALNTTIGVGNFMFEGMVANISRNGFKVTDLPMRFNPRAKQISTIISTPDGNYKLVVRSKWVKELGYSQDVGFEIVTFGSDWMQFLDSVDPIEKKKESNSFTSWVN